MSKDAIRDTFPDGRETFPTARDKVARLDSAARQALSVAPLCARDDRHSCRE